MKQEILLEEIKKILDNSTPDSRAENQDTNPGPYPDILPTILHKLKNKLTPVLGYSQILQMKNSDDNLKDKIDKIERNAVELTELFDNLKDSLNIQKQSMRDYNINELIVSENRLFQSIKRNGIGIVTDLDKNLPLFPANKRQISLLLQSVVQNSITGIVTSGSEEGEIIIKTCRIDDRVVLKIRDNGCGIDPSDINNIWTPFFSKFPGRGGIGLLIAETVISDHKGKFSVESEPGIFSEFTFEFPVEKRGLRRTTIAVTDILFVGFSREETEIIEKVTEDNKNFHIKFTELEELRKENIKGENGIIFFSSGITGSENLTEKIINISDEMIETDLILFYSGGFPQYPVEIFTRDNIRVLPDRTKLLTIINILATAINKEE